MLTLTRRQGESIILQTSEGEIEVYLAKTKSTQASIGISAPESVQIIRSELLGRKTGKDKP